MAEFLKTITDKFLDFFNIGRAMSIFIPGALVSFALLMLFSLVFFPVKPFDNGQKAGSAAPAQKPVPWTMAAGKDDNKKVQPQSPDSAAKAAPASGGVKQESGATESKGLQSKQAALDSGESLGRQLASDFKRVTAHYWVVVLLSLSTGACFRNGAAVLFVLAIGLTVYVFYQVVFEKIYVSYRKAALDLIKGVTDVKNKGLIK